MSCPAGWAYSKMYRDSLQASQQQCSRISFQPRLLESFHCQPGWFGKFSFGSDVWESSLYPSVPSTVWLGGTSQGGTPIYPFLHARILFGCSCAVQATCDLHPRLAEARRGLLKSQKLCWFTLMGVTDGCFHPCLFSRAGPNLQTNIGPVFILFGKGVWIDHVGCWSHICQIKRAHTGASHCGRVQMQSEEWSPREELEQTTIPSELHTAGGHTSLFPFAPFITEQPDYLNKGVIEKKTDVKWLCHQLFPTTVELRLFPLSSACVHLLSFVSDCKGVLLPDVCVVFYSVHIQWQLSHCSGKPGRTETKYYIM